MPQIAQLADTYASQVFWLLIFFGFTFFVIGRGMVPKVMDTVALRDKQIADDLAAAQAARDAADEREEAWRKRELDNHARAQAVIAKAKSDGSAKTEKKVAAAQKRLDKKLAEAEQRVAQARSAAMTEVAAVAAEAAQDIVARLAGASVDAAAANAAVKEALANG